MTIRSPRTILAATAAVALTVSALAPTAVLAKGPGGSGDCDGDCSADRPQAQLQIQARDGSGGGAQQRSRARDVSAQQTATRASAGGGGQVQAQAGNGGNQNRQSAGGRNQNNNQNTNQNAAQGQGRNAKDAKQGAGKGPNEDGERGPGSCDDCEVEMGVLTEDQEDGLVYMAYEEKLTHDVYAAFAEQYGVRVFANIAGSEARHQEAVAVVLERYGLENPTATLPAGDFSGNDLMASLYETLVAEGSESLEQAIAVGVQIEEMDIEDLQSRIAGLEEAAPEDFAADVHEMYSHLLAGSQNHLAAFGGWQ